MYEITIYVFVIFTIYVAGIAQLGEQQTEDLEVPCSIHGPGIVLFVRSP